MIKLDFAKNKTYYVVGLGKSNRAAIKALRAAGAEIRIWDDNADNLKGFDESLIREPSKTPWSKIKAVVMAPGIAPNHEVAVMAQEKNVPVICDIDLYAQSKPQSKVIGVTGTNGKSTVTALINHILNFDDKSQMGGNIGEPVLSLKNRVHYTVLELSSYQLDRSPNFKCDVAVLLNITPDHLEWHGSMDHYVRSKSKIFDNANVKIISIDDEFSKSIFNDHDDAKPLSIYGDNLPFNPSEFSRLKGGHNLQNMLAAYETCRALDVEHDVIMNRMKTFEGLPHRQYLSRVINGIAYINDSKATNGEAAKHALRAYKNIFWICGGKAKEGGLNGLGEDLKHVQQAYVFGDARADFETYFKNRGVTCTSFETLNDVVERVHIDAQNMRGEPTGAPTVLFSPACASFDQYENFEVRGDHFVDLVEELEG
jgi:UDP-N-acetylmuramoylalanine--D-glutamate ligase